MNDIKLKVAEHVATIAAFVDRFDAEIPRFLSGSGARSLGLEVWLDRLKVRDPLGVIAKHRAIASEILTLPEVEPLARHCSEQHAVMESVLTNWTAQRDREMTHLVRWRAMVVFPMQVLFAGAPDELVGFHVNSSVAHRVELAALERRAQEGVQALSKQVSTLLTEARAFRDASQASAEAAEKSRTAAAQASGAAAANGHVTRHEQQSVKAKVEAGIWLGAAVALAVIFVLIAWCWDPQLVNPRPSTAELIAQIVRLFAGKLALMSMLLYGITVSVRSFRAQRHNALVHDHRVAVFSTFQAFFDSAKDDKTKDVVLTQTLQLVMAQQPTGFLPNEAEATPGSQALDLIDKLFKLKGGKDS